MPLPPPRTRVLRYLVASPEHAARLFPEGSALRDRALDALAREGGSAVVVESFGGSATVATMPLANGHEVAAALAGVPGAVTFMVANGLAVGAREPMTDCGPSSRDPSLAAIEVEVVRLRKVEAAARALLDASAKCTWCTCLATCIQSTTVALCCDACATKGDGRAWDIPTAAQVRALEAALSQAT